MRRTTKSCNAFAFRRELVAPTLIRVLIVTSPVLLQAVVYDAEILIET
jgi:hypothetical protein